MNQKVTVICTGGWKYTGTVISNWFSLLGEMKHIKIRTKKGIIIINTDYVIATIYEEN